MSPKIPYIVDISLCMVYIGGIVDVRDISFTDIGWLPIQRIRGSETKSDNSTFTALSGSEKA